MDNPQAAVCHQRELPFRKAVARRRPGLLEARGAVWSGTIQRASGSCVILPGPGRSHDGTERFIMDILGARPKYASGAARYY